VILLKSVSWFVVVVWALLLLQTSFAVYVRLFAGILIQHISRVNTMTAMFFVWEREW